MQGLTDMLQDGIIQMRVREKITFVVSALALRYLKIYLCNVKINSCSLNMPFTLTVCVNINPTFISCEDITAPRKTRAKGWRKLRTNHFQENRLRESGDETTLQRAPSPFYREATDQKDKRTGVCAESPDVPGCSDQRLGGLGVSGCPWWATEAQWDAGGDTCDAARGHRARQGFLTCFLTEFRAVNSHTTSGSGRAVSIQSWTEQELPRTPLLKYLHAVALAGHKLARIHTDFLSLSGTESYQDFYDAMW